MKLMISSDGPHAHYHIRMAWGKVFTAMGHEAVMWDISKKAAFDAFDEFEPDIFIGQTYQLNRAVLKCIKARPHMKVVLRASDWGDMQEDIDLEKYPILVASQEEIDTVAKLREETGKPDFVYNHYHDKWMKKTHNKWESIGVRPVSMLHAADVFEYAHSSTYDHLVSDVSFVGGYWPYKARTLDKYIIPLCHPVGRYNVKIFGNQEWPVCQYVGFADNDQVKDIFRSATISPNISEPHSQDFGYDIIERPFKILLSGGFCISDYVQSMAEDVFTNDEIVYAHSPEEFADTVSHYLKYPDERLPYIQRGFRTVLDNHTYFHRVSRILKELDLEDESKKCLDLGAEVLNNLFKIHTK
jgi:hypothetical protein